MRAPVTRLASVAVAALLTSGVTARAEARPNAGADADHSALSRVLSAVQVNLDADRPGPERAVLVRSAHDPLDVDFYLFAGLPDEDDKGGHTPVLHVPALAFAGIMTGESPWLEVAGNGSLRLNQEWIAAGRDAWDSTLTIAARDGELRVAGWTRRSWDRITASTVSCDWNLLTGNWERTWHDQNPDTGEEASGRETGVDRQAVTLAKWPERAETLTAKCQHENQLAR